MGLDHLNPQYFPGQFQELSFNQPVSYAPSSFVHHDTGYGSVDSRVGDRSPHDVDMQLNPPYHVSTAATTNAAQGSGQNENDEKYVCPLLINLRLPSAGEWPQRCS